MSTLALFQFWLFVFPPCTTQMRLQRNTVLIEYQWQVYEECPVRFWSTFEFHRPARRFAWKKLRVRKIVENIKTNAKESKEPEDFILLSNINYLKCFLISNINCSCTGNFLTIDCFMFEFKWRKVNVFFLEIYALFPKYLIKPPSFKRLSLNNTPSKIFNIKWTHPAFIRGFKVF